MWVGVILDGGGGVYGWVSRSPLTGMLEVVTAEFEARRFETRDEAWSAASDLLRLLIRLDVVIDLYTPGVMPAETS